MPKRMLGNANIRLIVDNTSPVPVPEPEDTPAPPSELSEILAEINETARTTPHMIDTRHPAVSWVSKVISAIRALPTIYRMVKTIPAEMRAAWREAFKK